MKRRNQGAHKPRDCSQEKEETIDFWNKPAKPKSEEDDVLILFDAEDDIAIE